MTTASWAGIVSPTSITNDLRAMHDKQAKQYGELMRGVFAGKISPATFQQAMMGEIEGVAYVNGGARGRRWGKADKALWGTHGGAA